MKHNSVTIFKNFGYLQEDGIDLIAEFEIRVITQCICDKCSVLHPLNDQVYKMLIEWQELTRKELALLSSYYGSISRMFDAWHSKITCMKEIIDIEGVVAAKEYIKVAAKETLAEEFKDLN